jgi:hypothetical protein
MVKKARAARPTGRPLHRNVNLGLRLMIQAARIEVVSGAYAPEF